MSEPKDDLEAQDLVAEVAVARRRRTVLYVQQLEVEPIEIELWAPSKTNPGTIELVRRRVVHDVLDELNAKLTEAGVEPDEYGFSNMLRWEDQEFTRSHRHTIEWPAYRWIAVFAVTGGSEGHYIHIETIARETRVATLIGLAKTFRGWDHACQIAAVAGRLLQV